MTVSTGWKISSEARLEYTSSQFLPSPTDTRLASRPTPSAGQESVLKNIQLLHEAYRCKLITLFELDDEENQGSPPDLSHALLEALIKVSKTTPDHAMLPAGASLRHPIYGLGKMIEVHDDGRRHVAFGDTGEVRVFTTREAPPSSAAAGDRPRKSGSKDNFSTTPIFNLTEVDATLAEETASNKAFARKIRPSGEWHLPETTSSSTPCEQFDTLLSKALTLTVVWNRPKVRCMAPPDHSCHAARARKGNLLPSTIPFPVQLARKILSTMLEGSSVEVGTRDEVCAPRVTPRDCRTVGQPRNAFACHPGGVGAAAGARASAW